MFFFTVTIFHNFFLVPSYFSSTVPPFIYFRRVHRSFILIIFLQSVSRQSFYLSLIFLPFGSYKLHVFDTPQPSPMMDSWSPYFFILNRTTNIINIFDSPHLLRYFHAICSPFHCRNVHSSCLPFIGYISTVQNFFLPSFSKFSSNHITCTQMSITNPHRWSTMLFTVLSMKLFSILLPYKFYATIEPYRSSIFVPISPFCISFHVCRTTQRSS